MGAYSNGRLLFGALASTSIAVISPTLWFMAVSHGDGSGLYVFTAWALFSVATLLIGAAVSFLVAWPAALLFENSRIPTSIGVVVIGTLAWPVLVGALVLVDGGSRQELPLLALLGAALGLVTSIVFVMAAGARVRKRAHPSSHLGPTRP